MIYITKNGGQWIMMPAEKWNEKRIKIILSGWRLATPAELEQIEI